MRLFRSSLPATVLISFLGACGDSGTGPGENPDNGGSNGGEDRVILADPSFATVIQEIFNRRGCASSSCHGSAQQAGLTLTSGSSYASLVNVVATQSTALRVIPGNANGSYLVIKVEGRQTAGARMPLGGAALDNIDLTNLKNWIDQGAKNN
ncbi:MAG: hypothetical protein ACWGSQ_09665 [Longimicrobiales bacterium]